MCHPPPLPKPSYPKHRNVRTQRKYGGPVKEYDGGHLIATLFQGPAEKVNLVPQLAEQNRNGDWREMERKWARNLKQGNTIEIDIHAVYHDDGNTPKKIIAYHSRNNENPEMESFQNI